MRAKGAAWERAAERYLARRGLRPLARNVHSRGGEIDLVMTDGDCLVFVEVRYRAGARHGGAIGSVTPRKQARVARAAAAWLVRNPRWAARPCRFDVVAVEGERRPSVNWIRGAFDAPAR